MFTRNLQSWTQLLREILSESLHEDVNRMGPMTHTAWEMIHEIPGYEQHTSERVSAMKTKAVDKSQGRRQSSWSYKKAWWREGYLRSTTNYTYLNISKLPSLLPKRGRLDQLNQMFSRVPAYVYSLLQWNNMEVQLPPNHCTMYKLWLATIAAKMRQQWG